MGSLEEAAGLVKRLPKHADGHLPLAAHVTPEGHWTFSNREGAAFTAATPDEMGRVAKALAPDAPDGVGLSLYLSEDSVFLRQSAIDDLPAGARLNMVVGKASYPIVRRAGAGEASPKLFAKVRDNVLVAIGKRADFREAMWQLRRSLSRADIRVLSLKPGSKQGLSPSAKFDAARKVPLADEIDPSRLANELFNIRGQTAVVTGRIDGDILYVLPSSGSEQALSLSAIRAAAADADVNLVVLHAAKPLQPGGQNWLWQTVEVGGLGKALEKTSFGDFLDALAGKRGDLVVKASDQGGARVLVEALPDAASRDVVDSVGTWVGDAVSDVTGHVVTEGVQAFMTSQERQKELDERIVPGIPSDWQFYYIGAMVMGVIGLDIARHWFDAIWPPEQRAEYRGGFGYHAARLIRWFVFVVIFLPLVGPFALIGHLSVIVFGWLMMPVRAVKRLLGYRSA
ncbi:MAG: hypothetical protein KJ587_14550 [Alphaproteobacteria bacterium]|nr:hypothetical protein [Alphaproteobacteria bacterium]